MSEAPKNIGIELERLYDEYELACTKEVFLKSKIDENEKTKLSVRQQILAFEEQLMSLGVDVESEFM